MPLLRHNWPDFFVASDTGLLFLKSSFLRDSTHYSPNPLPASLILFFPHLFIYLFILILLRLLLSLLNFCFLMIVTSLACCANLISLSENINKCCSFIVFQQLFSFFKNSQRFSLFSQDLECKCCMIKLLKFYQKRWGLPYTLASPWAAVTLAMSIQLFSM